MINEKELIQILDNYKKEMELKEPNTIVLKSKAISIENLKWLLTSLSINGAIKYHSIDELRDYINKLNPLLKDEEKDCYFLAKELLDIKQRISEIYLFLREVSKDNLNLSEYKVFIDSDKFDEIFYKFEDIAGKNI